MLNLNNNTKILDIVTTIGHTALEFGRLLNCEVTGIDIIDESMETLKECYYNYMHLFNENNSHMGFTIC